MASVIFQIWKRQIPEISVLETEEIIEILRFASALSVILASRIGAAESMPYFDEVKDF